MYIQDKGCKHLRKDELYIEDVPKVHEIMPNLFLAGVRTATSLVCYQRVVNKPRTGIKFLLSVYHKRPKYHKLRDLSVPPRIAAMRYRKISSENGKRFAKHLPGMVDFIHFILQQKRGGLLVHDLSGKEQAAAVVIGYVMKYFAKDLDTAYDMVLSKMGSLHISETLMLQLGIFERLDCKRSDHPIDEKHAVVKNARRMVDSDLKQRHGTKSELPRSIGAVDGTRFRTRSFPTVGQTIVDASDGTFTGHVPVMAPPAVSCSAIGA